MRKLTNDKICDTFFSDEDINREVLLQLITDLSEFKGSAGCEEGGKEVSKARKGTLIALV